MIAIDENFRISETGGTGNATIFVNATTENPFTTASTQIEVSSSVGNIKRYVTLNKKAAHGYMYTPVEWISNEGLLAKHWVDLDYVWKDNSKVQFGLYSVYTNTKESWQVFGEENEYDANGNIINDNDDVRFFLYNDSAYWDVTNRRVQRSVWTDGGLYNKWRNIELGNNYVKNMDNGYQSTGSTYSISRTKTVGLFGSPKYALSNTDRIRYKYIKIYEGDSLVKDIIPVLDKDNIPCFFDKLSGTFYYYKVNDVPSTGLTAGDVYEELEYLQGNGSDYVDIGYTPNNSTSIEIDFEGDSGDLFGATNSGAGNGMFGYFGGDSWNWRYANRYGDFPQSTFSGRTLYKMTPSGDYVNNVQKNSWSGSWSNISASFYIFGIHRESTGLSGGVFNGKIYGVKIFEGETLVRDYVPVKSGTKKGFYDKVLGNFYPSNNNKLIDGNILGNLTFTVIYDEEDITINNDTPSTAISTTFNLNASTTPTGATLTYSSSDTSIATVDSNGVVTAVGKGTATITITAQGFQDNINKVYYNTTSKTVSVECAYPTQQIVITNSTPSEAINPNDTFDLNASTTPTGATVTYSSSDTSVATVSNQGIVTAVATGSTTITIVAEGFDDDVNHITYTSASTTVSVTVADGVVETYDFVDGDGNDYIITDYAPNSNSVIEVKFESRGSYGNLIGFRNDYENEVFVFEEGRGVVYITVDNDRLSTQSSGGVIKQNGSSVEVDGSPIGSTSYISNTDNLPLYIFALNRNDSEYNTYQGIIFYVKVWENNTLVHEWVGATKGNKVGMYDTVTSAFTASQYNGLTVGNEVLPEDSKYFLIKATSSQQGIPPYVHFTKKGTPSGSLYYRVLGNAAWTEVTGDTTVELAGETGYVELKGSIHNDEDNQWHIEGSGIEPQGYLAAIARNEEITSSNNSIAGTYAKFYNLFNGNYFMTNITNIIFPTDTDPACYKGMFINCSQITTAPILPATSLKSECYKNMFKSCYRLNTIPSAMLPSTSLKEDCYYGMFEGCSSITTGPNLPAPSTIQGCYYRMFYGCNALTELKVSFTNTPGSHINYWLKNIYSTGTLYAPSNATYSASDLQLPSNWTLSKTL